MVGRHLQVDEHSVHAHQHVVLHMNDAWEPLRLSRISLTVACDVASDAYLGYTLALTGAPTPDDLDKDAAKALVRELKAVGGDLRALRLALTGAERGPALGVAVMTDTDNTGEKAVGEYAGIRIGCGAG